MIANFIDFFIHLDRHLNLVIQDYGVWTYLILFLIIFCETGLVVTPLLPGDSLLFVAGAFAANDSLNVGWLLGILCIGAILGDSANYLIGNLLGPKACSNEKSRFLKKEYLERTHKFYERYGGMTIILARFVPIVRTFAPFLAGVGTMNYWRFASYNVVGGILWVGIFVLGGYFFGNLPIVKNNFTIVIFTIIFVSVIPTIIEYLRQRSESRSKI